MERGERRVGVVGWLAARPEAGGEEGGRGGGGVEGLGRGQGAAAAAVGFFSIFG